MKLIRQLWYILGPKDRIQGGILLLGLAVGAALEAVNVGLVVPFIAVLTQPDLMLSQPILRSLSAALGINEPKVAIIFFGLGLLGAYALKSCYLVFLYHRLYRYAFGKQAGLARRLMAGYLSAPYTFHLQRNSADLIKATTETTERFTVGFLIALLTISGEGLVVGALVMLLFCINPLTTFGAVLALGLPGVLIYRSIQKRLADAGRIADRSMGAMIQWTEQALSGIKETLVMHRTLFFMRHQNYHARRVAESLRTVTFLSVIPRLLIDAIAISAMIIVALIIFMREKDLQSLLPVLGMFAIAAMRLLPSASRISSGLAQLRFHYASTETLYKELCATEDNQLRRMMEMQEGNAPPAMSFNCLLALQYLSYQYPSMHRAAIDDISLEIPQGHWIGFVGATGAGKTTLVDLILGLLIPTSGKILIDGRDLNDDVQAWQRNVGYVPQEIYLIDDTIRRNVALGLSDAEIDDDRVWDVLRAARVDGVVRSLPDGLDTMTGQRGERLSGGERQRLGIARALYGDPEVLVVDEATANLDNETEAAVVSTLNQLRGAKTIIVIAHRLEVVKDCDCVYVLKQGRIHNSGTLSNLISTDPTFHQFAKGAA